MKRINYTKIFHRLYSQLSTIDFVFNLVTCDINTSLHTQKYG